MDQNRACSPPPFIGQGRPAATAAWRHVEVTDRHTAVDYAHVLKDLADVRFAAARTIVLVQDNLNIRCKVSLYEAFPAAEARRLCGTRVGCVT